MIPLLLLCQQKRQTTNPRRRRATSRGNDSRSSRSSVGARAPLATPFLPPPWRNTVATCWTWTSVWMENTLPHVQKVSLRVIKGVFFLYYHWNQEMTGPVVIHTWCVQLASPGRCMTLPQGGECDRLISSLSGAHPNEHRGVDTGKIIERTHWRGRRLLMWLEKIVDVINSPFLVVNARDNATNRAMWRRAIERKQANSEQTGQQPYNWHDDVVITWHLKHSP